MSSQEEEETEIPSYMIWFGTAAQPVEGVSVTPSSSPAESPGTSPNKLVTMDDEENVRTHFQARKVQRGKLTSRKKALLNLLDTAATEADMVTSRNIFQQSFEALEDSHGEYVASKNEEVDDPKDDEYMEGPRADWQEVAVKWAVWHSAKEEARQAAFITQRRREQEEERAQTRQDEAARRAQDKLEDDARR